MIEIPAVESLLPTRVLRAEYQEPTLVIGGADWSLSVTCAWRWVNGQHDVVSPAVSGVEDEIWNLAGLEIMRVSWLSQSGLGSDPSFDLGPHGWLTLFSDAAFDTWVFQTPSLVLVGPLQGVQRDD